MLGTTLKALRQRAGLTHRELAQAIGVTRTFITQVENNSLIPSSARLQQLATVLNGDFDQLTLLAGRIPPDVVDTLRAKPALISTIRLSR